MSTRFDIGHHYPAWSGRWLFLAPAAWGVIAALTLGLFAASIPGYVFSVLELVQAD